jgi:cytochrome P450
MPSLLFLLSSLILAFIINRAYLLRRNYLLAKTLGYPIILSPVASVGLVSIFLHQFFKAFSKWLPGRLGDFSRITAMPTWAFFERHDGLHAEYGPIFIHCSPSLNEVHIADPNVAYGVLSRRKDFLRTEFQKVMAIFGPNVDTLDGEEWARHRRLTAPCFNENVSAVVWEESRRQAKAMLRYYTDTAQNGTVNSLLDDTRTIALNILSHVGFGVANDWVAEGAASPTGVAKLEKGYHMSFRDALHRSLGNMIAVTIFGRKLIQSKMAAYLGYQDLGCAFEDTGRYIASFLDRERDRLAISSANEARPNLTSALLRASEEAKKEEGGKTRMSMTDTEIVGNLFIFSVAGHDTTANTLMYAICLLAIFPKWQDWVREELGSEKLDMDNYKDVYPNLLRVQAVMVRPNPPQPIPHRRFADSCVYNCTARSSPPLPPSPHHAKNHRSKLHPSPVYPPHTPSTHLGKPQHRKSAN